MIESEAAERLVGARVFDAQTDKIGVITDVYSDGDHVNWAVVQTGTIRRRQTFIPLDTADEVDGEVFVDLDRDVVRHAPATERGATLDADRAELFAAYYKESTGPVTAPVVPPEGAEPRSAGMSVADRVEAIASGVITLPSRDLLEASGGALTPGPQVLPVASATPATQAPHEATPDAPTPDAQIPDERGPAHPDAAPSLSELAARAERAAESARESFRATRPERPQPEPTGAPASGFHGSIADLVAAATPPRGTSIADLVGDDASLREPVAHGAHAAHPDPTSMDDLPKRRGRHVADEPETRRPPRS